MEILSYEQISDIKVLNVWAYQKSDGNLDVLTADGMGRVDKWAFDIDVEKKTIKKKKFCTFSSHIKS